MGTTKIAVLADTHWKGDDAVPASVLEQLEDVDIVIHAGDLKCEKVMKSLSKGKRQVYAVRGNNFDWDLAELPETRVESVDGFKIGVVHDLGHLEDFAYGRKRPEDLFGNAVQCVVFGQTHRPFFDYLQGVPFVNPGSATDQDHRGEPGTLAFLEVNGNLQRVSFVKLT
ncbi:MAG TPA: YfcE family phosphodiesterase [Chloroflexota bacterium]|nr:YfcE family phosphodiesterase [Chloroflexota bacterium]